MVLYPIEGGFEIELVGEIANMVKLPADAGSFDRDLFRSSVKVVAEERYRRRLLPLRVEV